MCSNKKVDEETTCKDFLQVQQEISRLDRTSIQTLGRASESGGRVHQVFLQYPIIDTIRLRELTRLTDTTINTALSNLQNFGIIAETTGQEHNRLFSCHRYLYLLD